MATNHMEKEIAEIQADVKTLIEISKITRHEQDKKNEVLFDHVNEVNKTLGVIQEGLRNNKEYIQSISNNLKEHKVNHFSFVKILSVAIGGVAGLAALFDMAKDWGR